MHTEPVRQHGHVLVLGASIAGLLAARVLSRHFQRVTLIERDALPAGPDVRKGVPQARHVHGLLVRGEQILNEFFPGITDELLANGAHRVRFGGDLNWHHFGVWKTHFDSTLTGIAVSRPYLELEIRRRLLACSNVQILDSCVVTGYDAMGDGSRITGVFVRDREALGPGELLHADLVIDASGRGSQTPQRLKELGYEAPAESQVCVNFGYASRIYQQPDDARDWKALYVVDRPPARRAGLVFPMEGNRWIVTLAGWHGDHPPTDEAGFLAFARSLPVRNVHAAIANAQPLGPIVRHGIRTNWRRHYERLARLPSRLLVLGDALCSFNPIYGQGMTVAAIEATVLDGCLRELAAGDAPSLDALTQTFHQRAANAVDTPWQMASTEDLRFPETGGERSFMTRVLHWYTARLHEAAGRSAKVAESFYRVAHMIAPRETLFRPGILLEVLKPARAGLTADSGTATRSKLAHGRRVG